MDEILADLREAFEINDYEVGDVSRNRSRIRVVLLEGGADAEVLRAITDEVVGSDAMLGLNITTESVDGHEGMNTVVSFQYRP